jgi:predicted ester cyclase
MAVNSVEANRKLVEAFDDMLSAQDFDRLDELCTPDMVNHALAPARLAGLAGTREFLTTRFTNNWGNDKWEELTVIVEDDLVVQYGVRAGHWPGGDFLGFDVPEGDYRRDVAFMYRIRDGRIAERWAVRDDLGMMRQLGAITPNR